MISWMQKHNKYLVWTIWVATIAFIGAGFVGWGSYNLSSSAGAIAKVGDIEIKQSKFSMVYNNLYNRYSQKFQGDFDDAKAKELGLVQQAFQTVETQARLLNYAKELGIIVSDEELAQALASIPAFQKDGAFDKTIYQTYLKNYRLTAKTFESAYREDLIVKKMLKLLNIPPLAYETETVKSVIGVSDKLRYKIITPNDVNLSVTESELKAYWEENKENYMTPKRCKVEILWTDTANTEVSDAELKNFYETNSFNYVDSEGKTLTLDEAKERVLKDLKIKKSKKSAQKAYIAYKKGEIAATETKTLVMNDPTLSKDIWAEIELKNEGDMIKPKVVNDKYATVKIVSFIKPTVMTFEEAKPYVTAQYKRIKLKELLEKVAQKELETIEKSTDTKESEFVSLNKFDNIEGLKPQESLQFVQKLFTSLEEKGMISVTNKVVVYKIVAQKYDRGDDQLEKIANMTAANVKQSVYESNLLQYLRDRYKTEVYRGGLKGE